MKESVAANESPWSTQEILTSLSQGIHKSACFVNSKWEQWRRQESFSNNLRTSFQLNAFIFGVWLSHSFCHCSVWEYCVSFPGVEHLSCSFFHRYVGYLRENNNFEQEVPKKIITWIHAPSLFGFDSVFSVILAQEGLLLLFLFRSPQGLISRLFHDSGLGIIRDLRCRSFLRSVFVIHEDN